MRDTLFIETVEVATTRDVAIDQPDGGWIVCRERPPGRGWRVDQRHDRENHSVWIRRQAYPALRSVHRRLGGWLK